METGAGTVQGRVLLVDSQPCLRGPLVVQLENAGLAVHVTDSAVEAVEYAAQCRPLLAVVDFDLPCGASGLRLAETLRRLHAVPTVFYTFTIHDQAEQAAAAAGALRLLSKELPVEDVFAAIREVCRQIEESAERERKSHEWGAIAKKENLFGIYVAAWQETPEQVKSCLVRFSRTHNLSLDRLADLQVDYQRAIAQLHQEYQSKIAALRPPELLALHRFHERQVRTPGSLSLISNPPSLRAAAGPNPS